jgi:hypothetical protein
LCIIFYELKVTLNHFHPSGELTLFLLFLLFDIIRRLVDFVGILSGLFKKRLLIKVSLKIGRLVVELGKES